MILGLLLLAFPLWPITMPLWLLYLVKRHADRATSDEMMRVGRAEELEAEERKQSGGSG